MRVLLGPDFPATADSAQLDLHAFYGADWVDPGGLRVNFVSSVDGAVTAGGLSGGLQTPGDNRIFAVLRDLADVIVAGAGTVAAEHYRPVTISPARSAARSAHGLSDRLPIAVVSRSLNLDLDAELFDPGPEQARTLVLTCAAGGTPQLRSRLASVAELIDCGEDDVDLTQAVAALSKRGYQRILCEGGPRLFADLAAAGVVDELCLSLSPVLAGPGSGRITAGTAWPGSDGRPLLLTSILEEDGALFLRYRADTPRHRRASQ